VNNRLLLKAALRYAKSHGYSIVPLHSVKDGRCSCGDRECQNAGKHPRTKHGVKDATTDKATILGWWRKWPNANIGIATGARSGIVAVDIDPRHDGNLSFRHLINEYGSLPPRPTVATGGGGRHLYFQCPDVPIKSRAAILPGIDVRGERGYVVAPPSRHASGKRYRWGQGRSFSDFEPPALPTWLLRLLEEEPQNTPKTDGQQILSGERNTVLTSLAGAMRRRGATEDEMRVALLKLNQDRCKPPLPDKEVERIVASVSKYASAEGRKDPKRSDEILRVLLGEGVTFFHTPDKEAYVRVRVENHTETWTVREASFKRYIASRFYRKFKAPLPSQALNDIVATLEGTALYDNPEQDVFTRVAEHRGAIYLDLCNPTWQAVKITARSWRVVSEAPVKFRRSRGMKALPVPKHGGSIAKLRSFLNLASDDDFVILNS